MIWRHLPLRAALALAPAWVTLAVLVLGAPGFMKLTVGALFFVSLASPYHGLLTTAAVVPFGQVMVAVMHLEPYRLTEAFVVAFLAGWLLRGDAGRPGPRVPGWVGWILASSVIASVAGQAWEAARMAGVLPNTVQALFYGYYLVGDPIGFIEGARVVEGVAAVAAAASIFRQQPQLSVRLPAVVAGSASLAAISSVFLWKGIAPEPILRRHALIGERVSAHVADVNAAGSYFALVVCVALGMSLRARGRERLLWLLAAIASAVGLWLTDSRTATGAAVLAATGAAAWYVVARWRARTKAVAIAAVVLAMLAAGGGQLRRLSRDPEYRGVAFRREFNATSARMIAARPWTGVGVGQYLPASPLFMSPQLAFSYGSENAHNYFLQFAGELGLIGLGLFILWTGSGVVRSVRALRIAPRDGRLLGLAAGSVAFLATCLTGHPLLIAEVAFPFWMLFGLTFGLSGSTLLGRAPAAASTDAVPRWQVAAAALAVVGLFAVQITARRDELRPSDSRVVTGMFEWETAPDGAPYRWTGDYASLFVPADVTRVYVPIRMPAVSPALSPMRVEAKTTAAPGLRVLVGDSWTVFNVELPDSIGLMRFKRINLKVERTWRPALVQPGNADMRAVGVQVGPCQLFRER